LAIQKADHRKFNQGHVYGTHKQPLVPGCPQAASNPDGSSLKRIPILNKRNTQLPVKIKILPYEEKFMEGVLKKGNQT